MGQGGRKGGKKRGRDGEREKGYERQREGGMQRWENGWSKERDYGSEVATEGRRGNEGKENGGMDGQMIETHNKQLIPDLMKLFFH